MKNTLTKLYVIAIYLLSTIIMFAQAVPGNNDNNNNLEGNDTPAPIGEYVWILALIGVVFLFLKFRSVYVQELNKKQ